MTTGGVPVAGRRLAMACRPESEELLAGGPVWLAAELRLIEGEPIGLVAGSSRASGRSTEYRCEADGLRDPFADAVEIGGVETTRRLSSAEPVREELLLNQFLTLEDLLTRVPEGATARVDVRCRRRLLVDPPESSGEPPGEPAEAVDEIAVTLRRDDARVREDYLATARTILAGVVDTVRNRLLIELTCARSPLAGDAWQLLTSHPDPVVAGRARQMLP